MNGNGTMTWNEFCEAAKNAVCIGSAITAKDEAKQQVRQLVMDLGAPDLDEAERPEDAVGNYCNAMKIQFSKSGDIIGLTLPDWVANITHRMEEIEYLKEDILTEVHALEERDGIAYEVTDEQMERMICKYEHDADCNIPYNVTIEHVVRSVLKGEW